MSTTSPPLILTLTIDAVSQDYFTGLRDRYFPRHCNYLQAHLTLFHHLPADEPIVSETIKKATLREQFQLRITGIRNIGKGVAFTISSTDLQVLHHSMQQELTTYLISQDRQKLWPHITVQNKVTAFKAKETEALLIKDFSPFAVTATGISSWLYLDGPWQHRQHYPFGSIN